MYPAAKEVSELEKKITDKLTAIKQEEERRMAEIETKKQEEANKRNAAAVSVAS